MTNPEGHFRLNTSREDGVLPGTYKVVFTRVASKLPPGVDPEDMIQIQRAWLHTKQWETVPKAYTKIETTPVKVEVPRGGKTNFLFDLPSKPRLTS